MQSAQHGSERETILKTLEERLDEGASLADNAVALAEILQERGSKLQTSQERRQQAEFEKMVQDEEGKATLMTLTDQAFRAKNVKRIADQLTHVLDVQGIPRFFTAVDRAMLRGFQSFGSYLPGVSVPMVKSKMREETANVILPAEDELLHKHLEARRQQGLRMNVNFLGEALLGEMEASQRLSTYLAALQTPEIEVISVKVSTLYSQLTPLSRRHAVAHLADRLELLYRAAQKERFERADGTSVDKLVYLDMEEYRDMGITVDTFIEALSRPGLQNARGGIALQAYVPDALREQGRIIEWAKKRVARGGAPITMRLVKGANMEMERVESSIAGWPLAPFHKKIDTDANFKKMLHAGLEADAIEAVHLGVASHNLFEVAYAFLLAQREGCLEKVHFEMLEGMVNHQRRALDELARGTLLYAPATKQENFVHAIGYLIRRLDENTGPQNFLRHAFKLSVGSPEWIRLRDAFVASFDRIEGMDGAPHRQQDRNLEPEPVSSLEHVEDFVNEPDTDFSLLQNLRWGEEIIAQWRDKHGDRAAKVPGVVAGEDVWSGDIFEGIDPSRPRKVVAEIHKVSVDDIDRAVACAKDDPSGWRSKSPAERSAILAKVADEMRKSRGRLMGAALAEGGKILSESDPEVSEAIDFVMYYAVCAREFFQMSSIEAAPMGVVAVVPPWNFPIAIPCGGISAGLAAGNTVVLKPATDVAMVAYELCQCFWRAGVPKEALQFVPASGRKGGARLVASPDVDAVILTGGTDTALTMLEASPDLYLLAETGGKNAMIVTSMADRDLAVLHTIQSAFGHAGQKCSATSLLILEAEVFDDPGFRDTLIDAASSMRVGSAWKLDTKLGPMIRPPSGDLEKGLKELERSESWALMPRSVDNNPHLYSPAIKWSSKAGGYTHMTEFFGPVLTVMRADSLEHAIELVNQTGYGLTSGLHSLDEREQEIWSSKIRAGNLYINRGTTGAIVLRQPFGGVGKSAFGPGIKAGGPNYVAQLMTIRDAKPEQQPVEVEEFTPRLLELRDRLRDFESLSAHERTQVDHAIQSYARWNRDEFGVEHDATRLIGQDNIRRYLPVGALRIRVSPDDSNFSIAARFAAAICVGSQLTVSVAPDSKQELIDELDEMSAAWGGEVEFVWESDEELAEVVRNQQTDRVRYADRGRVPTQVRKAVGDSGIYIADLPVLAAGRVELLWYVTEQSLSVDYHRYGNLGKRGDEHRSLLPRA